MNHSDIHLHVKRLQCHLEILFPNILQVNVEGAVALEQDVVGVSCELWLWLLGVLLGN